MKSLISSLAVGLVLVTSAAAVSLIGLPMGKGSLSFSASYNSSSNLGDIPDARLNIVSGGISYGLTDNIDFIASYKSGTSSNYKVQVAPAVFMAGTYGITGLNLLAKWTVLNELKSGSPVSIAVGAGCVPFSVKVSVGGADQPIVNGSRAGAGLLVSKLMIPFVPYFNILYTKNGGNMTTQSEVDTAIGSYIALSKHMGFFVEYSNNAVTPDGGTTSTSGAVEASFNFSR